MEYRITCPHCEKTLKLGAKHLGKTVKCPACMGPLQTPTKEEMDTALLPPVQERGAPREPETGPGAAAGSGAAHLIACPNCTKTLKIYDRHLGQVIECPFCKGNLTAPTAGEFGTPDSPNEGLEPPAEDAEAGKSDVGTAGPGPGPEDTGDAEPGRSPRRRGARRPSRIRRRSAGMDPATKKKAWIVYLVLAGMCGVFMLIGLLLYSRSREVQGWSDVLGKVVESGVRSSGSSGYVLHLKYEYSVEGRKYTSDRISPTGNEVFEDESLPEALVREFPPGADITVYYNPQAPGEAYLKQGDSTFYLLLLIMPPVIFAVLAYLVTLVLKGKPLPKWAVTGTDSSD